MTTPQRVNVIEQAPAARAEDARPAVKRLLRADGAILIAATFAPGQSWDEHQAAHPVLVQCLSGALDFTVDGEEIPLQPGAVVHLPARVPHQVVCPAEASDQGILLLTMLTAA